MNENKFKNQIRPRRLRKKSALRSLISENQLSKNDLIFPLFVKDGKNIKTEISSMPGIYHYSPDSILKEIESLLKIGLDRIILFGIPISKDNIGSDAFSEKGIIQKTIKNIKTRFPEIFIISDVCMCEYTSHGHCGIISDNEVKNDLTLPYLEKQVISHANSGVDMIAPSGMVDGMVGTLRTALDKKGFTNIPIMSYSVKYSSAFYGPFRDAAESKPSFGDRKKYQMDPANSREALREIYLDINEGADILMVKPAMSYMDIIYQIKKTTNLPIAAYNVSGEYSMIKAASSKGWIDGDLVRDELMISLKRAGADIIITYFAKEIIQSKYNLK
tara:strand:+ start:489 stop:1481 length:993 start_codon:yes stop_codon:yes gene_type:complete